MTNQFLVCLIEIRDYLLYSRSNSKATQHSHKDVFALNALTFHHNSIPSMSTAAKNQGILRCFEAAYMVMIVG